MSLRLRLILGYSALLLVLALAAWLGLRSFTRDLTDALGETAASVGRSVYTVMRSDVRITPDAEVSPNAEPADPQHVFVLRERRERDGTPPVDDLQVVVNGKRLTPEQLVRHRAEHPDFPGVELVRRGSDGETMLRLSGAAGEHAIPLPRGGVDEALQRYTRQLGWGLLALLVAGLLLATWLAQRVTQAASVRAERELAELGEIGRGLAHSLRNPLHALGLSLEALAAESGHAGDALAQSGREQLQRLDQTLRSFLALSAGSDAEPSKVRVSDVVDDVLMEASQRALGRVRLRREGDDLELPGVPTELRVMLHTLVVNAVEASPPDGEVVVRMAALSHGVRIEVTDAGEGVPDEVRARLFQPHVSGKPHGAGMGLYLAQRLAQSRYAGQLALHATPPRGTVARLDLGPRRPVHG